MSRNHSTIVETADPSGDRDRSPSLLVLRGIELGRSFRLRPGASVIGREPSCELSLQDAGVSREHARVIWDGKGKVGIADLKSTNGTFVNGTPIEGMVVLEDGDRVGIGRKVELKFTLADDIESEAQHQLYDRAVRDPLTRVFNKRYLDERLIQECAYAERHNSPLSLLVVDLDHFKSINDTHGHAVGDMVLQEVAAALAAEMRQEDLLARFGGEEFVVVLRHTPLPGALLVAERLRSRVAALKVPGTNDGPIQLTTSVGAAVLRSADRGPDTLFARADHALYEAKQRGRNQVVSDQEG